MVLIRNILNIEVWLLEMMFHRANEAECLPCRVLATQASAPLVYVPIEAIASKWYGEHSPILFGKTLLYLLHIFIQWSGDGSTFLNTRLIPSAGESEKMLSQIFEAAEKLDSCLVFLDEIDSLATSRG